ncbi:hypothetical protein [Paenibacillus apiarius]|uniref:Uncharacterized protein n=1 Tax=Paenibacillus apiarius TaxID=46240 RepID=A0ABT4DS66_9BACL|nr:hypothetical protein [Paenibacillus apiarius]MBN3526904.1 hypothetical protein [Paenibacillus apiarius]MCY9513412.1 hypothetical protein [Paenibacillus apiarius]MCY9519615.1 hypothetical protein [Paenibacillus apiarius]MCY9553328.1 hypothetical protein [Paenibacillus apiarius]MCY9557178.1 hypothetical protein [Paenibacillus apiarius]
MMASIGVLLIVFVIISIEVPALRKNGATQELRAFWTLLALGTVLGIALGFKLNIPNPLDWIAFVYKPITSLISSLLD